ncbi:MAG: glycoside hydrolase family 127 protein, partial [Chloroflexi bacterium]|nr:glycoside hydrolase family 127 protein [Chloroflexota bacterium]
MKSPAARWEGLSLEQVSIADGFWGERQQVNRDVSLGHGFRMLEQAGNLWDLRLAGGTASGEYRGPVFMDSDVYKWLEAVGYQARDRLRTELREQADQAIALVQAAQQADGYLDSYYQVVAPERRWQELNTGHELYCAGHLAQAAVAWHRYAKDDRLLEVVRRVFDHVLSIFGTGKRVGVPGHPEVELALVDLYRTTGERRYLELAQFFVDHRGHGLLGERLGGAAYFQDRVPVRDASEVEGHAVRALYLTSGVTDLYLESGEQSLLQAMLRQWHDFTARKMYLTGGAGSRHNGEAFGHAYELPNERAYCETCAAIASIMWNWRLLLATGEARFADLIERTLYNGFLSGVSLSGDRFFYVNPLLSRGKPEVIGRGLVERQPWFLVACCPPNVMRTLASLGGLIATRADDSLQVHQYIAAAVRADDVAFSIKTEYPWRGVVEIHVDDAPARAFQLELRKPAWAENVDLRLNGEVVNAAVESNGYVSVQRVWQAGDVLQLELPIAPRLTEPHPLVESTRGCVAIERGPLVYCLEQADHPEADVLDLAVKAESEIQDGEPCAELKGAITLKARGMAAHYEDWSDSTFRRLSMQQ